MRGPIYSPDYKPQFSGHETFPLRYGWLKKAYDEVARTQDCECDNRYVFLADDAIARFGVGKNMVSSMRHWSTVLQIIENDSDGSGFRVTALGRLLLSDGGVDPYFENPASTWLLHWMLCHPIQKTTWHWAFNYFALSSFERDQLVGGLTKLAQEREWVRVSRATVKRDVECFVRTYATRSPGTKALHEDALESPFAELGLLQPIGKRDGFRFVRGPKRGLSPGVFAFAVDMFWKSYSSAQTISFEALAHHPGSPGKVFLLAEDDLAHRLADIESVTEGRITWSETAGMKQLIRLSEVDEAFLYQELLPKDLNEIGQRRVA